MTDLTLDVPFLWSDSKHAFRKLVRRKHSNPSHHHGGKAGGPQLAKQLKVLQLVGIGIGSTIGAGVYVLVGTVARDRAGPSIVLSFLIAGIAAALSAFCYAELASRCPSAGSAYHYAYTCVGEGIAWLIGWALILEYTVGGAAVARGISPNLGTFFGGAENLPFFLVRRTIPGINLVVDPCAALLVIIVTLLLSKGIKESAMVQSVMTLMNVSVLIFVILVGLYVGFKTGWQGYNQPGGFFPFGFNGMLGGSATVFFAYIGFDTVASTAEEVKRPQRDLPLGIGLALLICSSLYMAVSAVIVGIVPYQLMNPDTPMSSAFSDNHIPWAMYVVAAGAVAALSTTLMGSLLPQPRILMAMSRDGLLPPIFHELNRATAIPIYSTVTTGVVAAVMAFSMDVQQLSGMVSVGTLLAFTVVGISILILRYVPPIDQPIIALPVPAPITLPPTSLPYFSPRSYDAEKKGGAPRLLLIQAKDDFYSPAFSILSEASLQTLPGVDEDSESESSSESVHEPFIPEEDEQQADFPETQTVAMQNPPNNGNEIDHDMAQNKTRRLAAALGIFGVCAGVLLVSIGTSFTSFPRWLRWIIGMIGTPPLVAGTLALLLIKEDEGRHKFGQSGGFHCPFVPILPITSILVNVYLLANLETLTWIRVSVWLALGALVYLFYGIHHSKLSKTTHAETSVH
ncbi:hypothetical protein O6H91_01G015300 [Diphasiastrum complanatum]|uniref:Uncharacterized protein n=4 Tax=Diphasiastrum complanatum TaxID=34168 RepID=A0ACC2ENL8_DIPCM|nr:hypothetical protein O6H91_01G015300 [Diphasiastrum complanatum]KAJ7568003.1 hypothetical protein O6H91_01G015300 [Diphasiastrum complanatum]KAJ7568005.1 hypothetical protein O6H91_01G015300 [Diphasiastrum complanatum]KAJ7568006.1 hypothetical protein O6H91_01G015300 [Diphasiastrum complanatum]